MPPSAQDQGGVLHDGRAGGLRRRPRTKLYAPTFWPAHSYVEAGALNLRLDAPTGVSAGNDGTFEWIVARHATKEVAFGILPVLAHPVGGTVSASQSHVVHIGVGKREWTRHPWVLCSDPQVRVGAVKLAANREGTIIRLHADRSPSTHFDISLLDGRQISPCAPL